MTEQCSMHLQSVHEELNHWVVLSLLFFVLANHKFVRSAALVDLIHEEHEREGTSPRYS